MAVAAAAAVGGATTGEPGDSPAPAPASPTLSGPDDGNWQPQCLPRRRGPDANVGGLMAATASVGLAAAAAAAGDCGAVAAVAAGFWAVMPRARRPGTKLRLVFEGMPPPPPGAVCRICQEGVDPDPAAGDPTALGTAQGGGPLQMFHRGAQRSGSGRGDLNCFCGCRGSLAYAHRECLERWRAVRPVGARPTSFAFEVRAPAPSDLCELCGERYSLEESLPSRNHRGSRTTAMLYVPSGCGFAVALAWDLFCASGGYERVVGQLHDLFTDCTTESPTSGCPSSTICATAIGVFVGALITAVRARHGRPSQ